MSAAIWTAVVLAARGAGAALPLLVLASAVGLVGLLSVGAWGEGRAHTLKVLGHLTRALTALATTVAAKP